MTRRESEQLTNEDIRAFMVGRTPSNVSTWDSSSDSDILRDTLYFEYADAHLGITVTVGEHGGLVFDARGLDGY